MAEDFKKNGTHSLDPQTQYVHSCSGYTIGSCKLEPMKTPNGQCTKRCRWLKVIKTQKTLEKQKKQFSESLGWYPPLPKSLQLFFLFFFFPRFLPLFRESWLGPPPSKESRNIVCFFDSVLLSKVFTKCGVLQGNWHESQAKLSKCLWECSKTSQNIILNHGKTALPGAAVLFLEPWFFLGLSRYHNGNA